MITATPSQYLHNSILALAILVLTAGTALAQNHDGHDGHDRGKHGQKHDARKHAGNEKGKDTHKRHNDEKQTQKDHDKHDDKKGKGDGARNKIHLKKDQRQSLNLKTTEVEAGSIRGTISAPATIAFDPDRVAHVGPLIDAKVKKVTQELGAKVEKGAPLAILESVRLGRVKARYMRAKAHLETAKADYQRQKKLADDKIASEAELLESRAKFKQAQSEVNSLREQLRLYGLDDAAITGITGDNDKLLSRYVLTSPISGTLQMRDISPGDSLSPDQTPLHVVNTHKMWVNIEVAESDIPYIAPGQTMTFTTRVYPGTDFEGRVQWVSHELDAKTRTVRVQAVITNKEQKLRAGMFGQARITTKGQKQTVLVPIDAVQSIKDRQVVFVPAQHDGGYRAVPVKTGEESNGRVEILSGLKPGSSVVSTGAFDLKSALTASGRSAAHSH